MRRSGARRGCASRSCGVISFPAAPEGLDCLGSACAAARDAHASRALAATAASDMVLAGRIDRRIDSSGRKKDQSVRGLEHSMHLEPAREFLEPTGAGGLLRIHAEPVTTLLEQVELHRALCGDPAFDDAHLSAP